MNNSPAATEARLAMKRRALAYLQSTMTADPPESQIMRALDLQVEIKRLETANAS